MTSCSGGRGESWTSDRKLLRGKNTTGAIRSRQVQRPIVSATLRYRQYI